MNKMMNKRGMGKRTIVRLNLGKMSTPALVLSVDFAEVGYEESPLCIRNALVGEPGRFENAVSKMDIWVAVEEWRQ